jgi:hypothetical protein
VLAILAAILALVLLTRGEDPTAAGSPTPSAVASPAASASATGSGATPSPSAATSGSPGTAVPTLAVNSIVATAVDGLSVRSEPGLGGERLGTLDQGMESFVVGGPTDADGFRWYQIGALGLPPNSGCAGPFQTDPFNCPIWFGWAAAASAEGEAWLIATEPDCPDEPLTAEGLSIGHSGTQLLACFGSDPITFRGWWPEIPDDAGLGGACAAAEAPTGWLLCQNINDTVVLAGDDEEFFGVGVRLAIDPASDATMPERGTWVEVRAHYDDPAAEGCADDAPEDDERQPGQIVLACRSELVLEEAQAVDGP